MPNYILVIICSIILLTGVAFTLIPIIPALPFMFALTLVYGFVDKFVHLKWYEIVIVGIITLISVLVDWFSGLIGAKYGGAAKWSLVFGALGFLIGLIILPPFGGFLGLFFGILISEVITIRDHKKALKSAAGGVIGTIAGMAINFLLALIFLTLFIIFSLK